MDKNSVIGLVLIFAVFAGFFWWNKPTKEQLEQQKRYNDSILVEQYKADSIARVQNIILTQQVNTVVDSAMSDSRLKDLYGVFSNAATGQESFVTITTPRLELTFSTLGGKLNSVVLPEFKTFDSLPLTMFDGSNFGLSFFSNNRLIDTEKMYFVPSVEPGENIVVTNPDGCDFSMRLYAQTEDGRRDRYIEFLYHIPYDDYLIDIDCNFVGMQELVYSQNSFVDLSWKVDLLQQEKEKEDRLNGTTIYYQFDGDNADNLTINKDGSKDLSVKTKWVSYKQQFFASTLIARGEESFLSGNITSQKDLNKERSNPRYVRTMTSEFAIPYYGEQDESFAMSMYFGPTQFKQLKQYDLGLEEQLNIGKFFLIRWVNRGIMFVFDFLERFISNYGIIILILTILLKLLLTPISYKSYLSTAKMRALKPEMDELSAKYPNQEDAMKKQQEMMSLYQKFGVSPMSGCLPMLLQFPILIAMFRFFPISFELRQKSFLWAHDLSTYDSILDLPFKIPFYGDHVSLFTLLMTISTIIYTKMNNKTMGQESQPGMKFMTYAMPIMFLGIFNSYSAGLSYYYLLFNLLTFLQTFIISKIKPTEQLRTQLLWQAANKTRKGSDGKSRWQKKLEELEKMQREQARQNAKRR